MSEGSLPIFDASAFEKLLGNADASVLCPLFDRAVAAIREFVSSEAAEFDEIEFNAHKLKTTCLQLGLPRLANILQGIEQSAHNQNQACYEALRRMLSSEFLAVEESLENYGAELRKTLMGSS